MLPAGLTAVWCLILAGEEPRTNMEGAGTGGGIRHTLTQVIHGSAVTASADVDGIGARGQRNAVLVEGLEDSRHSGR